MALDATTTGNQRDYGKGNGMSMSDLDWEIQELFIEGYSPRTIAVRLGCDIELVHGWMKQNGVVEEPQDDEIYSPYNG